MASKHTTRPDRLTRAELRQYDRLIAREAPAVLLRSSKKITARALAHITSDFALAQIEERRLVIRGISR